MSSIGQCSICTWNFKFTDMAFLRQCKHTFHKLCITNSLRECGPSCPNCRAEFAMADIIGWQPGMDITKLFVDTPESKPENFDPNVGMDGVLGTVGNRLNEMCGNDTVARAQVAHVLDIVKPVISGEVSADQQGPQSVWAKLWRILNYKGVKFVVIIAIFVLCCVFFWQLGGLGMLAAKLSEWAAGFWSTLSAYGPEILAILSTAHELLFQYLYGSKKLMN